MAKKKKPEKTQKIKLLQPYLGQEPGRIVEYDRAITELLIRRNIAQLVVTANKRRKK